MQPTWPQGTRRGDTGGGSRLTRRSQGRFPLLSPVLGEGISLWSESAAFLGFPCSPGAHSAVIATRLPHEKAKSKEYGSIVHEALLEPSIVIEKHWGRGSWGSSRCWVESARSCLG
jgi:hypothetical protein